MAFEPVRIQDNLYWVGAQNPDLRIFDVVMRTERGTSYNSYLLIDEKIVLFDAVKNGFEDQQLARIRAVVDPAKIDYIVFQHTEPDHSGGIAALLSAAPNAQVLSSRAANGIIKEILGHDFPSRIVKEPDTLPLGQNTLEFLDVPFLHWPDSIFTYIPNLQTLVSGDVFGFHRADDRIFTDLTDDVTPDQRYYFDAIFSPFRPYVRTALEKLAPRSLSLILPSHGTLYRTPEAIADVLQKYDAWSSPSPQNTPKFACIAHASSYGYTAAVALELERGLQSIGWQTATYDLSTCDFNACREDMARADALFIGSSTLNHDVLPPVWRLMTSLSFHEVKGKPAATFGSFGWSGEANKMMDDRLASLGMKLVTPSFRFRLAPCANEKKAQDLQSFVQTVTDGLRALS